MTASQNQPADIAVMISHVYVTFRIFVFYIILLIVKYVIFHENQNSVNIYILTLQISIFEPSYGRKAIIAICVTVISAVWPWPSSPAATKFHEETNTHTSPMSVVSFLQFATSMAPELRIY